MHLQKSFFFQETVYRFSHLLGLRGFQVHAVRPAYMNRAGDIQEAAAKAINNSVRTIVTSGEGEGYSGLVGLKEVLKEMGGEG